MNTESIILVSGFDSLILNTKLNNEGIYPQPVYFKWGLPNEANEIKVLPENTAILDIPDEYKFLNVDTTDGEIPDLHGRDTIMYVLAAQLYKPTVIYSGVLVCDSGYRETSTQARQALTMILSTMIGKECQIVWPWVQAGLSKSEVGEYAQKQNIAMDDFVSCYHYEPCCKCTKCFQRLMIALECGTAQDIDLARLLTSGKADEEIRAKIYNHFGTTDDIAIFQKVGL